MKKKIIIILVIIVIGTVGFYLFKRDINNDLLQKLYSDYGYKDGSIEECEYEDKLYYVAGMNANDAGSVIYNQSGEKVAECNYAWGHPDEFCFQTKNCRLIYVVKDNIWGYKPINIYNLK